MKMFLLHWRVFTMIPKVITTGMMNKSHSALSLTREYFCSGFFCAAHLVSCFNSVHGYQGSENFTYIVHVIVLPAGVITRVFIEFPLCMKFDLENYHMYRYAFSLFLKIKTSQISQYYLRLYGILRHMEGLVQDCSNSIADALEFPQFCTGTSIYAYNHSAKWMVCMLYPFDS